MMLFVAGEEYGRHAAAPDLAIDCVRVGEVVLELVAEARHRRGR
jgi:hypothetical protein